MTPTGQRRVRPALRVEAFLLAAIARAALRRFSLPAVARGFGALPRSRRGCPESVDECMAAAALGAARAAHSTCLFRSLVAFALLARRGHAAAVHLGAHREGGLSAHAWVTIDGVAVEPQGASTYVSLWRHGGRVEESAREAGVAPAPGA